MHGAPHWAGLLHCSCSASARRSGRRLQQVRAALCPPVESATLSQDDTVATAGAMSPRHDQGGGVGLPLARLDASGALLEESIVELQAAMASAAVRLDFRVAAQLKTMLDVLGPPDSSLDLEYFTSGDPDEAADLLLEHGFVVLPNQISPQDLNRMRSAYEVVEASTRHAFDLLWAEGAEPRRDLGKSYKFPLQLDTSTAYHPLISPPLLIEVLHRVLGQPPVVSELNEGLGGFVIPTSDGTPFDEAGYISWHRDRLTHYAGWPFPEARSIKASCYLYDVGPDSAPLTLVPGSHRLPNPPQRTLDGLPFQGGRGHYYKPFDPSPPRPEHLPRGVDENGLPRWIADPANDLPQLAMVRLHTVVIIYAFRSRMSFKNVVPSLLIAAQPNCVQCTVQAGSMVLWDNATWHTGLTIIHPDYSVFECAFANENSSTCRPSLFHACSNGQYQWT
jgi:hypothetical protein